MFYPFVEKLSMKSVLNGNAEYIGINIPTLVFVLRALSSVAVRTTAPFIETEKSFPLQVNEHAYALPIVTEYVPTANDVSTPEILLYMRIPPAESK